MNKKQREISLYESPLKREIEREMKTYIRIYICVMFISLLFPFGFQAIFSYCKLLFLNFPFFRK